MNDNLENNNTESNLENTEKTVQESTINAQNVENSEKKEEFNALKEAIEWIICTIIALILVLSLKYFALCPTVVKMSSMYPTLKDEQRLMLNRTHRIGLTEINRGDIITFEAPIQTGNIDQSSPKAVYDSTEHGIIYNFLYYVIETPKLSYIKRVIGIAGDHIEIKNSKVYLNGNELDEPYLSSDIETTSPAYTDFIVPEGYVFAIGDNRNNSVDCRNFGCIPLEKVEGKLWFRFWPLNNITVF